MVLPKRGSVPGADLDYVSIRSHLSHGRIVFQALLALERHSIAHAERK
jgi:hypothetical protein